MSKRLKLVSVRLKPDLQPYKQGVIATSIDVAFLMAEEIASFDEKNIGVLNLNAKGELISMNVVTLHSFEKNMADVSATSILSNAASVILISKDGQNRERKIELTKRFQNNMRMLGINVLDHVSGYDDIKQQKKLSKTMGFISYISQEYIERLIAPESVFLSKSAANVKAIEKADPSLNRLKVRTDRYFKAEDEVTKESALQMIQEDLSVMDREVVGVLSMDENENPINANYVSIGDLTGAYCSPRDVFKVPILSGADSMILFHNHPSGHSDPSEQDKETANRIRYCGQILGIEVKDNIIMGKDRYSFAAFGEFGDSYKVDPESGRLKEQQPKFENKGIEKSNETTEKSAETMQKVYGTDL